MIIKKFEETFEGSNGYLIVDDNNDAILIDAADNNVMFEYLKTSKINLQYVILTHEHIDHISGLNKLKKGYTFKVIASELCNNFIQNSINNMARYFETFLYFKKNLNLYENNKINKNLELKNYICQEADVTFRQSYNLQWNKHKFILTEIPGHSKGSVAIVLDNSILFSGDSLLLDYDVITKFPSGSTKEYNDITLPYFQSLDKNIFVYPGHGNSFDIRKVIP